MPKYRVTDAQSGVTLELEGDSPPTEAELTALFAAYAKPRSWGQSLGEFARGAGSQTKDLALSAVGMLDPRIGQRTGTTIGTAILEGAKTIPSFMRQPAATLRGFGQGISEPALEQLAGPASESTPQRAGRATVNIAAAALPFAKPIVRGTKSLLGMTPEAAQAAQAAARAKAGAGNLVRPEPRVGGASVAQDALSELLGQRSARPPADVPGLDRYTRHAEITGGRLTAPAPAPALADVLREALTDQPRANRPPADMPGVDRYSQLGARLTRPEPPIPTLNEALMEALTATRETPRPVPSHAPPRVPAPSPRAPATAPPVELPEAWKALTPEAAPTPVTASPRRSIDLEAALARALENAPTIPRGAKVRDELYRGVMQEHVPGGRVTGLTAKGEEAVREALEGAGFDKPRRSQFYREAEGARARYRRLIDEEKGGVSPQALIPMAGAGMGAAVGAATGEEGDDPLGRAILGALMGGGAGLAVSHPRGTAKALNRARIESMLSGLAIPKNIATAAGGAMTAAIEKGSTRPLVEAARIPANVRVLAQTIRQPSSGTRSTGFTTSKTPGPIGRVIGGIDETANQAYARAGLGEAERDRLLLTSPVRPGGGPFSRALQTPTGRAMFPFQRTPQNAAGEGMIAIDEALRGADAAANPTSAGKSTGEMMRRRALTVASPGLGALIGQWAAEDPKRRGPIAAVLLAGFGPRTVPATIGALTTGGAKLARSGGLGGLTPFPEMAFDPKMLVGWPPSLVRLIKRYSGEGK